MSKRVIEVVTLKLRDGVSKEPSSDAAEASTALERVQPGFIAGLLSAGPDNARFAHLEFEPSVN